MALNVTLASLKAQVRSRADQQNSNFIDDAELTAMINSSAAALYDKLVRAAADYYTASSVISIVAGTATYALPSNFYKLLGIDYDINGQTRTMSHFNFKERNMYKYVGWRPEIARYRVFGSNILFTPQEPPVPTVTLWYVPRITPMAVDADVLDGVNGWEEFVVLDAAIKCMVKEESDPSALMKQLEDQNTRILDMSKDRDQGEAETTTDSVGSRVSWNDLWNLDDGY